MGDIVRTEDAAVTLALEVVTQAPIERIEVRNGKQAVRTLRPYGAGDLGSRIRVLWSGAEYRGRGRETNWKGRARFQHASILRMEPVNAWNRERLLEQRGADTILFDAITTGNFGGFDVWLDEAPDSMFHLATNLGALDHPLSEVGLEDWVMEAGGLERRVRVFRLPDRPRLPRVQGGAGRAACGEGRQPGLGVGVHRRRLPGVEQPDVPLPRG